MSDIKVSENDLKRIIQCIDALTKQLQEEGSSSWNKDFVWEKDFIDYFKMKYKEYPELRQLKSTYYEFSKRLYIGGNKEDPNAKAAYSEYCKTKDAYEQMGNKLKEIAKAKLYI